MASKIWIAMGCLFLNTGVAISNLPGAEKNLASTRPNIILILTDDQGYGDFSCHGNPILKTPFMDQLHNEGAHFNDFLVSPTCSPTRSALLTGRHEFYNGVTHTIYERERMALDAVTLADALKGAGYNTGIFGKWHLGDEIEYQPQNRGFNEVFIHGGGGIGQTYPGSCGDAPGNTYQNPVILHNGTFEKTNGYCTDVFFEQAIKWMKTANKKEPFFCYLATNAPHTPLQVKPEDEARYKNKVPDDVSKFYGMISNIDENIGRLLQEIKKMNIDKNTLIVFMTDNGGYSGTKVFNAGMRGTKATPYRGGTRGASFWYWPEKISNQSINELTAHIDVFPTLAEIAGVNIAGKLAAQIKGISLLRLLIHQRTTWPDRVLISHVGRWGVKVKPEQSKYSMVSVRTSKWSMVSAETTKTKSSASNPIWELYDLTKDPGETTDLSGNNINVVKHLTGIYDTWWSEVKPYMINEGHSGPAVNPFKSLYWKQFGAPQ